ncbi:MAG: sugar nucleotide-binding protein [Candidatus Omnitrophota bacterium]
MNKNILIIGKGFVGSRIHECLGWDISDFKIACFEDAQKVIDQFHPEIIINCIGYTGRNVDQCELNKDKTLTANTFVPLILAEAAIRNNIRLVHISSGCIYHFGYDKNEPILENQVPDFLDLYYSRSKIYSEAALNILAKKYPILILRIRIPLDNRPHPKNILTKLIEYKKVIDVPNSITYIPDFLKALEHLINIDARGIYNLVNSGGLRYKNLLDVYKKYKPDFNYENIDHKKLNLVRTNLILSTKKLEDSGFKVRPINEVLEECVKNYLKS